MKRWGALLVIGVAVLSLSTDAVSQPRHREILRTNTEARLAEIVKNAGGVMGLAVLDLTSGERFGINDTLQFPQGSAIKIPIMMEVWKQAREGKFSLAEKRAVPKSVMVGGSGVLQFFGDATSDVSIRDLTTLMIILSDNTATNMLIDLVGLNRINATLVSMGMMQTKVQRRMINEAASARGEENLSTPLDALRVMEILFRGQFIDRGACDEMLSILKYPKSGEIKNGLPAGVPIAFKPGGIAGVRTEWAIVYVEARPFAVAVMENYLPSGDPSSALTKIGETLYEYFWRLGHASRYGTYVKPEMIKE